MQWPIFEQYSDEGCADVPASNLWSGILYFPGDWFFKTLNPVVPPSVGDALRNHCVHAVVGHFTFGLHRWIPSPAQYMTFLREPVGRVTSIYFHLENWKPHRYHDGPMALGDGGHPFTDTTTLEEFVSIFRLRELDNDQTRRISGIEPEFGACSRDMVEIAKRNIEEHFQVVGLTERFDESLVLVKETLGWTSDLRYFPRLVNDRRVPVPDIPGPARDAILERNQLDIELYEFAEERFQAAVDEAESSLAEQVERLRATNRELGFEPAPSRSLSSASDGDLA